MAARVPDVSVIGAGIIGLATAWRLAQRGLSVTVYDAGRAGAEASWAGAGMLAPGGEVESESEWSRFAVQSIGMYRAFVHELEEESGLAIDYRGCGALELAFTEEEWQRLQTKAEHQRSIGIPSTPTDGGLFYPEDAVVNPRDIVQALLTICRRRGIEIHEHEPVVSVQPDGLRTERSIYPAGAIVLAAGAWSSGVEIVGHAIPAAFPLRGHLLGADLAPNSLKTIVRHGHTYLLQRSNGFTIAGSSEERAGFDRSLDPAIVRDIEARATAIVPAFATAANEIAWTGFRPATASLEPEIRKLEGCPVWLAYGHYRNGILLAPATAARIADQVTSNSETGWSSLHAYR